MTSTSSPKEGSDPYYSNSLSNFDSFSNILSFSYNSPKKEASPNNCLSNKKKSTKPLSARSNPELTKKKKKKKKKRGSAPHSPEKADDDDDDTLNIPQEDELMRMDKQISEIAKTMPVTCAKLRQKLKKIEANIEKTRENVVLPFQIRRAKQERRVLRREIENTEHVLEELNLMSTQLQYVIKLRDNVRGEALEAMKEEVKQLKEERETRVEAIREGFISRINLLHLYWPWRQLFELGDTNIKPTFKEELMRGPRYRNVNLQNVIQSELLDNQLHWLESLMNREDVFRGHLRKLDGLVEDLTDITDLLESSLTCEVCDLLFENPVMLWPCGHTFCYVCCESLKIGPHVYRCPICRSVGTEGFIHNLNIGDSVGKWMFKDSGYGDLKVPLDKIRTHTARFKRESIADMILSIRELIRARAIANMQCRAGTDEMITVSYRAY